MSEIKPLVERMHSEFCSVVNLAREVEGLGKEDSMEAMGRRWSLAIDILSRTARVHSGARAILKPEHPVLMEFASSPFCWSWYHDFARHRNTECAVDRETLVSATCSSCEDGYLPCRKSLAESAHIQRGMEPCREMRDRYEHYDAYFLGHGRDQISRGKGSNFQPSASKPLHQPWVLESSMGEDDSLEIRIDVYERGGRRAFMLDVGRTVSELRPVVQAAVRDPRALDQHHEETCMFCH